MKIRNPMEPNNNITKQTVTHYLNMLDHLSIISDYIEKYGFEGHIVGILTLAMAVQDKLHTSYGEELKKHYPDIEEHEGYKSFSQKLLKFKKFDQFLSEVIKEGKILSQQAQEERRSTKNKGNEHGR